jgi:hypothetical protein
MTEIIALFGATGGTGKPFLDAALTAGYKVRAMVRTPSKLKTRHDNLMVIEGDFSNADAIQKTIEGATYVVSMAGGPMTGWSKDYPKDLMINFVKILVPLLKKESSVKVLFYQAGAFSALPDGTLPWSMRIFRTLVGSWIMGIYPNFKDNEAIIQNIDKVKESLPFKTIVTRPGGLKDSEGGKTLVASDTDPETGFVAFQDLAKWSLTAMKDESLYGKYPFVKLA